MIMIVRCLSSLEEAGYAGFPETTHLKKVLDS
ncbi:hypothetical protein L195_g044301, partial [Trifolium pratense]